MQSKCSTTSGAAVSNIQLLHISAERFKEICIRNTNPDDSYSKEINTVLDYFFNPYKELSKLKAEFDLLKLFLSGGLNFEQFKKNSI